MAASHDNHVNNESAKSLAFDIPVSIDYQAIEALQDASIAAGWDCEYRQIEPGQLEAQTLMQQVGNIPLLLETANRRLEVAAGSPRDALTLFLPMASTDIRLDGRRLAGGKLVVVAADRGFNCISHAGAAALQMHIPISTFECVAHKIAPGFKHAGFSQTKSFTVDNESICRLRNLMLAAYFPAAAATAKRELESLLVSSAIELIGEAKNASETGDRYHRLQKTRILRRAIDYIDGHLHKPIQIPDVCDYAGTSLSTLERLFKRNIQLTPIAYIRARRLDAARRIIEGRNNCDRRIGQIASDHGFPHFGRFSAAYKNQFGSLPSDVHI